MIESAVSGINASCFAYGMTGSGKTHTILGDLYNGTIGEEGISNMAIDFLFNKIQENETKNYVVKMSYLEIYNEQIIDLLGDCTGSLMIVEDPLRGVIVPGLSEYHITSSNVFRSYILKGNQRRTMAETSANQFSSRSHAILQLLIEAKSKDGAILNYTAAKLFLIDLAGSERGADRSE